MLVLILESDFSIKRREKLRSCLILFLSNWICLSMLCWFSEGGKTVIHVSAEEAGSVKLGDDFKSFVNDGVHDDVSH